MNVRLKFLPSDVVGQATGLVSLQLGTSLEEAETRLRDYAFRAGKPLAEVSEEVITRRLEF